MHVDTFLHEGAHVLFTDGTFDCHRCCATRQCDDAHFLISADNRGPTFKCKHSTKAPHYETEEPIQRGREDGVLRGGGGGDASQLEAQRQKGRSGAKMRGSVIRVTKTDLIRKE